MKWDEKQDIFVNAHSPIVLKWKVEPSDLWMSTESACTHSIFHIFCFSAQPIVIALSGGNNKNWTKIPSYHTKSLSIELQRVTIFNHKINSTEFKSFLRGINNFLDGTESSLGNNRTYCYQWVWVGSPFFRWDLLSWPLIGWNNVIDQSETRIRWGT